MVVLIMKIFKLSKEESIAIPIKLLNKIEYTFGITNKLGWDKINLFQRNIFVVMVLSAN